MESWPRSATHIAGLFVMLILLTAGRLPLQGARQVLIPKETNAPVGTEFKVKVGETIVASKFMNWNLARLNSSTSVAVGRYSQVIGPDVDLEGFGATQASRERTGLDTQRYYCASEIKVHSNLSYQLFSSVTSNVEQFIRFCFADENSDGQLDHVFLGGAKSRELQVAREIEPVAFRTMGLQPDKDVTEFHLILKRIEPGTRNILLYQRPRRNGKEPWFGQFSLWGMVNGVENPQKDKVNVQYAPGGQVKIYNVMGYDLTVKEVDHVTGEVTFVCDKISDPVFYQGTESGTQIFYIYI